MLCNGMRLNIIDRAKKISGVDEGSVNKSEVKCPGCGSEAIYRYGRTHNGNRRFFCVLCKRQFSADCKRPEVHNRPSCPQCGRPMHIYKRGKTSVRFRCSGYPVCRTYRKIIAGEGQDELLCA